MGIYLTLLLSFIIIFLYLIINMYINYKIKKERLETDKEIEKIRIDLIEKQNHLLKTINKKLDGIKGN